MSDSEFEATSVTSEVPLKKKRGSTNTGAKATSKRKSSEAKPRSQASKPRATSPAPYDFPTFNKVNKKRDLFHILQSEEAVSSGPRAEGTTTSSFSSRVSTGTSRRTASTTGPFFVDLKVYKTADYNNHPVNVRYKTALVSVKLQCDDSSSPWEALQRFLSQAWTVFEDSEPVHYSDKISFK